MGVERIKVTNDQEKEITIPSQFTHSVKLSETAKGVRIDVHVYATDRETAINEALQTYLLMQISLKNTGVILAPMEVDKANEDKQRTATKNA
jgi:hypothetical protein